MNHAILSDRAITRGFVLAGAVNVFGMLIVSKLFTNSLLSATDPAVFSWHGQVAIVLWGLAYWAAAQHYRYVPYLVLVFLPRKDDLCRRLAFLAAARGPCIDKHRIRIVDDRHLLRYVWGR